MSEKSMPQSNEAADAALTDQKGERKTTTVEALTALILAADAACCRDRGSMAELEAATLAAHKVVGGPPLGVHLPADQRAQQGGHVARSTETAEEFREMSDEEIARARREARWAQLDREKKLEMLAAGGLADIARRDGKNFPAGGSR